QGDRRRARGHRVRRVGGRRRPAGDDPPNRDARPGRVPSPPALRRMVGRGRRGQRTRMVGGTRMGGGGYRDALTAAELVMVSNAFMTLAWYGLLRFRDVALPVVIVISWGIAFFEYLVQVPANRIGYRALSGYQLKILQEAISLVVFIVFARG